MIVCMKPAVKLEVGVKAFIVANGSYLMLRRTLPYEGKTEVEWEIPGGRIEPSEPTIDALRREIAEETGLELDKVIEVLAAQDIQRVSGKHTVRITYLVTCKDPDKTISLDLLGPTGHDAYKWMTVDEIKKNPHDTFIDPVIPVLESKRRV